MVHPQYNATRDDNPHLFHSTKYDYQKLFLHALNLCVMFPSQKTLIFLIFIGSVKAAALTTRGYLESATTTQSCHATCHGAFASYSIWVGVPYGGSPTCDNTYEILETDGTDAIYNGCLISSWKCVQADDGNTQLWFNAPRGKNDCLNRALERSYTDVNSFNCPGC